ncbi:MAG TPA: oxygenase MpaB family protein [Chitinophagaceae bacterium]|nr:oxygenase MpaB family protein [Chitinophagaceae bacterium]
MVYRSDTLPTAHNILKTMNTFVAAHSIVRKIWGKPDLVLFIFAGAAAEFSLNKSVDWLYFTGKLPKDPMGRMFSTVAYAHQIIFMNKDQALAAIDMITKIHKDVENKRGMSIPDWAYRDVLFLLIWYSVAAFELLERKLTETEKEEVFNVFYRLGLRMDLQELPEDYTAWELSRKTHLQRNLERTHFSNDLFLQYKKQLGPLRYHTMIALQWLLAPPKVRQLLCLRENYFVRYLVDLYSLIRNPLLQRYVLPLLVPTAYRSTVQKLYKR